MNLDDAFGDDPKDKATPLKEALKEPEVEEHTKEDLRLQELGLDYDIFKHYTKKKLTTKEVPYKDFFIWYLERATASFLGQIQLDQLPENLQTLVAEELESDELTKLLKINAENSIYIEKLEVKTLELQKALKKTEKERISLLQGVKKLNGDTEKDELYKKIQGLQAERDKLKKGYVTVNGERLKWLYEFMSNMSFNDYQPTPEEIERLKQIEEIINE